MSLFKFSYVSIEGVAFKMKIKFLAAAVSAAALLGAAGSASATVYNLDAFQNAAFTPPFGTVTVTGQGTNVLSFNVQLNNTTFFQMQGNSSFKDAFWFDLTGLVGGTSVAYNITAPNADGMAPGGDYPVGGFFQGANFSNDAYGQGFLMGYDYAVQVRDNVGGTDYYTGQLAFTVTAGVGSTLNLASRSVTTTAGTKTVFGGADLRDCPTTNPTAGTCATGPVGFTLTQTPGVPEPATWAMMIMGFGGVGALMRRRRMALAAI